MNPYPPIGCLFSGAKKRVISFSFNGGEVFVPEFKMPFFFLAHTLATRVISYRSKLAGRLDVCVLVFWSLRSMRR